MYKINRTYKFISWVLIFTFNSSVRVNLRLQAIRAIRQLMARIKPMLKLAKGYTERGTVADLSKINDYSQIAQYAAIQSIADFVKKGLIVGSGTSIYPMKDATRAEVAVLLYRLYNSESIK